MLFKSEKRDKNKKRLVVEKPKRIEDLDSTSPDAYM